jgi:membrane protein DedA with SNARE-associated domain
VQSEAGSNASLVSWGLGNYLLRGWSTEPATLVFWGQLHLAWARFLLIDAIGCLLIAAGFTLLGSLIGHGTRALAGEVKRIEHWLLIAVIDGVGIVGAVSRLARRRLGD